MSMEKPDTGISNLRRTNPQKIVASGFNAHGQLSSQGSDDLNRFQSIFTSVNGTPQILFANWSVSAIVENDTLTVVGCRNWTQKLQDGNIRLRAGFGDHNGLVGCLDQRGHLYLVESDVEGCPRLVAQHRTGSPLLNYVAQAGNDRIAVTRRSKSDDGLCDVLEFESREVFESWFEAPAESDTLVNSRGRVPGIPKQLLANIATFTLLMEDGEVYTWGDPRHRSLARSIQGEDAASADTLGYVEALGGLRIVKIASGGWMSAALSADGAVYLWGAPMPGTQDVMHCLEDAREGNAVALIELSGNGSEPLDFSDVALGENHAVLLTDTHRIFVVGANSNGQLGLGPDAPAFCSDWHEVNPNLNGGIAHSVVCGTKSTYVLVQPASSSSS